MLLLLSGLRCGNDLLGIFNSLFLLKICLNRLSMERKGKDSESRKYGYVLIGYVVSQNRKKGKRKRKKQGCLADGSCSGHCEAPWLLQREFIPH